MKIAAIIIVVLVCSTALAQKPPQEGAPNISPNALLGLRHGFTQQKVEELLKVRGQHQFTAVTSNGIARCVSYYRNDVYGHYYLVFLNKRLLKICEPPPFEMREEPYRGTVFVRRVLGNPEARLDAVLQAEDMFGPRLTAALTPQTPAKRSWDPGLTAAFFITRLLFYPLVKQRERTFSALIKQFDPYQIVIGSTVQDVESRLGKAHIAEAYGSDRDIMDLLNLGCQRARKKCGFLLFMRPAR